MKGLTTRFTRPTPPSPGLVTRKSLGIPPRPLSPPEDSAQAAFGLDTDVAPTSTPQDSAHAASGSETEPTTTSTPQDFGQPSPGLGKEAAPISTRKQSGGADGGSLSCEALYLVPQTLYKLHPDFDRLVAGVLTSDASGCVVFIEAFETAMTEALVRRMSQALLEAGVGFERVIFIRRWVR